MFWKARHELGSRSLMFWSRRSLRQQSRLIGRRQPCSRGIQNRIWRQGWFSRNRISLPTRSTSISRRWNLIQDQRMPRPGWPIFICADGGFRKRKRHCEGWRRGILSPLLHTLSWGEFLPPRARTMTPLQHWRLGRSWRLMMFRCSATWPTSTQLPEKMIRRKRSIGL